MRRGLFRRFQRDQKGTVAIEFAIVALPLLLTIFVILECAVQYFVASGLSIALQKTGRQIRTGQAIEKALDREAFKAAVCDQLGGAFGCSSNLLLKVDVVSDIKKAEINRPIDDSGNVAVEETFDPGKSGDFVLVQAFLPWPTFFKMVSLSNQRTKDGGYVLGASDLFRNEPF